MRRWLGWCSPFPPVWMWHVMFDGTRLCPCAHSKRLRAVNRHTPSPEDFAAFWGDDAP